VEKHSRNFGSKADEIVELRSLLKLATNLGVNLHVNWNKGYPDQWALNFIENGGAAPGSCSHVLKLLTDAADLHSKELVGFAQNTSDGSLPPDEWLLTWYEKHGFHRMSSDDYGVPIRRSHSHDTKQTLTGMLRNPVFRGKTDGEVKAQQCFDPKPT
jgi:hypothetical protein